MSWVQILQGVIRIYLTILKIDNEKLIYSKGFSAIMLRLFTDCDVFEPDPSLRDDYQISEIELKNCGKKTLSEIKYRYP